ncbi:MAG: zinc-dependent peptidase [Burkholderiales bacterium]|nr:zinc-dependent peptidase [Burkholderiales bacterium]
MFEAFKRWRRGRVLAGASIPDGSWHEAVAELPFLADWSDVDLAKLRELVVLFLDAKSVIGAGGHEVTPRQRIVIAAQACVPVLELGLDWYEDFENVVVYPSEFVPGWTWEDEAGVVHTNDGPLAGEAMPGGPVVLSWPDVEASADFEANGMNLVIHEFAHKLDMRDGDANGRPPLPPGLAPERWAAALTAAYDDFATRVDRGDETRIDPYAAESPGEFFAVLTEVFFAAPDVLAGAYPDVYRRFVEFYRQDPLRRAGAGATGATR